MVLKVIEIASWYLPTILMVATAYLFLRRGLARRFPFFVSYLAVNVLHGAVSLYALRRFGIRSLQNYLWYYASEGVVLLARGFLIAELCYHYLRSYRGVWGLAWRFLAVVSAGLAVASGLAASRETHRIGGFVLTLQGGLEIVSATVLLLLLVISRYYRIEVSRIGRLVAVGFTVYSCSVLLHDLAVLLWYKTDRYLAPIEEITFLIVFTVWIVALWKPMPAEKPAPALLPAEVYRQMIPQMNYRLHTLNDRLMEFLRS